jgi:hypothetical protein
MKELAKSGVLILPKAVLRTVGESKIVKNPQVPELQELIDMIPADRKLTERTGFEPAVQTSHTQPFQGCSLSHSDTSPV